MKTMSIVLASLFFVVSAVHASAKYNTTKGLNVADATAAAPAADAAKDGDNKDKKDDKKAA